MNEMYTAIQRRDQAIQEELSQVAIKQDRYDEQEKPRIILIIDDSAADRKIYRRYLTNQDRIAVEILEASSAHAGLEICASAKPDCVILDFRLPDRDGLSLLDDLQTIHPVPVIFITGQPEALLVSEAFRRGVVKYISKDTVTSSSIQEAVYDALDLI